GISRDPVYKNYVIVMEYMPDGNLRQHLQNKAGKRNIIRDKPVLSLKIKLGKLKEIAKGLSHIHKQNLVHRDFHSGNILNNKYSNYITDLGLSRPVNHQRNDQIFGVLPYVAPEILQEKPYTQASDIYSFGLIDYELLHNVY